MARNTLLTAVLSFMLVIVNSHASVNWGQSQIDLYWRQALVQSAPTSSILAQTFASGDSVKPEMTSSDPIAKYKSPGKAFALSMLVPGVGQYYNGSKVKVATFLGIEATAWILQFKWHNDGTTLTEAFEKFQQDHWSEDRYSLFLDTVYGFPDDELIDSTEISHNLPDTRTQQYYEMTGKYDQFSWGWDDATLRGNDMQYYLTGDNMPRAIGADVPYSKRRLDYENMRYDANKKFSNARKMIMLALGNRLVSAIEAFISAKRHNNSVKGTGNKGDKREFSHWKFQGKLKSVYARYDTPYLKVTYGF